MLLNHVMIILLFYFTGISLATDTPTGCYSTGEKYTNVAKPNGDITDIIADFCSSNSGSHEFGRGLYGCTDGNGHSLVINIQLGDYPYISENVTLSNGTCITVLTHVRTECGNYGGYLKLSYINGAISDQTSASRSRRGRDQAINGNDRGFLDSDDEGDDEDTSDSDSEGEDGDLSEEYMQGDASGTVTTTTVITFANSTSTATTILTFPNTMISFTTSTTTGKKHKTKGRKLYDIIKTTETETTTTIQTISTTATASTTETITTTSSSPASSTASSSSPPPSSSSTINTDDFYGWVRIDPQDAKCSSTSTSSS